jgi:TusA-related sulfurtransferase
VNAAGAAEGTDMIDTSPAPPAAVRVIDARGSFCPGPLMELIRGIRESQVGDVLSVYSSDKGSKIDIPKWVAKAGHRLVSLEARDGYDEIVVEKRR